MLKKIVGSFLITGLLAFATPAFAIPTLQVDIGGGFYSTDCSVENKCETTITMDDVFTVYAYLTPGNGANVDVNALLADTYFLSVALAPKTAPPGGNFGSFDVDGSTVQVTGDMVYGAPPLEAAMQEFDAGDLPKHGIFETYFTQLAFQFDANDEAATVNVQDDPGLGPQAGTGMFYVGFDFDLTALMAGYDLHFDLYNISMLNGDIDRGIFAPFSHDGGTMRIPEPGSLALLGFGILALGVGLRRRQRDAA